MWQPLILTKSRQSPTGLGDPVVDSLGHPQKNLQFFRFVCVFACLYASLSEGTNAVKTTDAGKINASGSVFRRLIYGAGEQNRNFQRQ
jgi:hypothetical protein